MSLIGWVLMGCLVALSLEVKHHILNPLLEEHPTVGRALRKLRWMKKWRKHSPEDKREFLRLKDKTSVWSNDLLLTTVFCILTLIFVKTLWGWFVVPTIGTDISVPMLLGWAALSAGIPMVVIMLFTLNTETFIHSATTAFFTTSSLIIGFLLWKFEPPMSVRTYGSFLLVLLALSGFIYLYRWARGWKE